MPENEGIRDGRIEADIREWIEGMPICSTLGVRCLAARDGCSELTIAMTPGVAYAPGSGFPASVVASLIDFAGGAAAAAAVGTTRLATLDCQTQLMAPADGTLLRVDARVVRVAGRRILCFAEARVDDETDSCAAGMVLMGRRDERSRLAPEALVR